MAAAECPAGYLRIAPGTFMMGSPESEEGRDDDETQHPVTITRAYCMKATEVTQGAWQAVMGSNPSEFKNCGASCPVEQVSWGDAVGFANALSRREGLQECYAGSTFTGLTCTGYRLPTEAEWEYAARAGTTTATYAGDLMDSGCPTVLTGAGGFPAGTTLDALAWYRCNSNSAAPPPPPETNIKDGSAQEALPCLRVIHDERTHPVGGKTANPWGLVDMLGNVEEWTGDCYGASLTVAADPLGASEQCQRVRRGGHARSPARGLLAATRSGRAASFAAPLLGFRLARTAPEIR
jgi:formylglycine-generating enzyme required for sulfatase activity